MSGTVTSSEAARKGTRERGVSLAISLLIFVMIYFAGYFLLSEVILIRRYRARVFPHRAISVLYHPLGHYEARIRGELLLFRSRYGPSHDLYFHP